jgi:hypothetical protein
MELMWIIAVAILGVTGAAISRQMTDEFKAWLPRLLERIIDLAVCTLPEDQRQRFAEEWRSHVDETPGDIGKLIVALGFLVAASKMAGRPAAAGKRVTDLVFSLFMIACLAPLFIAVCLAVRWELPGPFFTGRCASVEKENDLRYIVFERGRWRG